MHTLSLPVAAAIFAAAAAATLVAACMARIWLRGVERSCAAASPPIALPAGCTQSFGSDSGRFRAALKALCLALSVAVSCAALLAVSGITAAVLGTVAAGAIVTSVVTDLRARLVPDVAVLAALWLGLASAALAHESCAPAIFGAMLGYCFLWAASVLSRGRESVGVGLGDAKLLSALGAWVGLADVLHVLIGGGVFTLMLLSLAPRWRGHLGIPFAPGLSAGAVMVLAAQAWAPEWLQSTGLSLSTMPGYAR